MADWIRPRLDVIRHSIESHPLSPELREEIRAELERQGLLLSRGSRRSQTVGLFVRSDTNVEDLENFNGAGLNLTLFNRRSLDDIYAALKLVWASPFTYRSFSWRQTLIDEPLWVLPSVVILESVPTTKSGVLVTADLEGKDRSKMLVATSEGVGGAVDGTPAETLVWSTGWRRARDDVQVALPAAAAARAAAARSCRPRAARTVLSDAEVESSSPRPPASATSSSRRSTPAGQPRAWDIEFGFADGKLWLFQTRPFIGNESLKNISALAGYEAPASGGGKKVSLDELIQ